MQIKYHKHFLKKYSKLSSKIQKKINARILLFTKNPFHIELNNHSLKGKYNGYWSINITGDIRAVYKEYPRNIYRFVDIDNHNNLYK